MATSLDALAELHGGVPAVDYDSLAKQFGGIPVASSYDMSQAPGAVPGTPSPSAVQRPPVSIQPEVSSAPSATDVLSAAHRGGTPQAFTEEPTTGPLNPLVGAVTAGKGVGEMLESGAVPPPASRGPAATLPTAPQRQEALGATAKMVGGGMSATAPFVAPAGILNAPARAAMNFLLASGASAGAHELAKRAGLSQEAQELAGVLPYFLPYEEAIRLGIDPKIAVASSAEGTAVSAGIKGAKGAVAVTPTEIVLRGGILGNDGEIRIPRKPVPAGLEPPTIEGQQVEPKPVHHASNDVEDLRASAERQAPKVGDAVASAVEPVPGAKVEAVRDSKDADRITDKANRQGVQPSQIADISGAKVSVPDQQAATEVLQNLHQQMPVEEAHGTVTGKPQNNDIRQVQAVVDTNAPAQEPLRKAEVILQTPEMHAASEANHDEYREAQDLRAQGKEAEAAALEQGIVREHNAAEQAAQSRQSSHEQAPIYETTYRGPELSIDNIDRIRKDKGLPKSLRDDAQFVYQAVVDSAMPIKDAMDLNGTDQLAKALGGKFDKTINAQEGSNVSTPSTQTAPKEIQPGTAVHPVGSSAASGQKEATAPRPPAAPLQEIAAQLEAKLNTGAPRAPKPPGTQENFKGKAVEVKDASGQWKPGKVLNDSISDAPQADRNRRLRGVYDDGSKFDNVEAANVRKPSTVVPKASTSAKKPDIGVDFDGTLFTENPDGSIGKPIPERIASLKEMIAGGKSVIIESRRVKGRPGEVGKIQDALESAGLPRLPVTDEKVAPILIDDSAHHVETNANTPLPTVSAREPGQAPKPPGSRGGGEVEKPQVSAKPVSVPPVSAPKPPAVATKTEAVAKPDAIQPPVPPKARLDQGKVQPVEEKPFKYRSTQVNIPEESAAAKGLGIARSIISVGDLAGKGRDVGGDHVTVRYGIQGDDTAGIKKYLASLAPFEASLGKTDSFPPSEHSDGAAVIVAPIEASELHKINSELEKHGDFTEPSFKEYKPHATIAYVKPEAAARYKGMTITVGAKFKVSEIAITDKQGDQEVVKLAGKSNVEKTPEVVPVTAEGKEPWKRANPPQVAQPLIKQRNVPFESKTGNGDIQHLNADEYILPGFEEYRIGITKPRGSIAEHNKLGYESYELTTGRKIYGEPHQNSTAQRTLEATRKMLETIGKPGIDKAIQTWQPVLPAEGVKTIEGVSAAEPAVPPTEQPAGSAPRPPSTPTTDKTEKVTPKTVAQKPPAQTQTYQEWVAGGRKGLGPAGITAKQDKSEESTYAAMGVLKDIGSKVFGRYRALASVSTPMAKAILAIKPEDRPISLESDEIQMLKDKAGVPRPTLEERAQVSIDVGTTKKIEPDESVPKEGKNFEGRYVKAALEPVKEAWLAMHKNVDDVDEHWKWMVKHMGHIEPTESSAPNGYPQKQLFIKVPDDGSFLIRNTPAQIDHALKAADKFTPAPGEKIRTKAKQFKLQEPTEADIVRYTKRLQEEIKEWEGVKRSRDQAEEWQKDVANLEGKGDLTQKEKQELEDLKRESNWRDKDLAVSRSEIEENIKVAKDTLAQIQSESSERQPRAPKPPVKRSIPEESEAHKEAFNLAKKQLGPDAKWGDILKLAAKIQQEGRTVSTP